MKKKRVKPNVINVMADGRVIPDAEFMAQPYVVVAEDNYDFHVKCNRLFERKRHFGVSTYWLNSAERNWRHNKRK